MGTNRMKKQRDIFSIRQKKNPAIFTYCDIIYTKAYRPETPGEFFKGYFIIQNFRCIFCPGVVRGRATSHDGFLHPNVKQVFRICTLKNNCQYTLTGYREVPSAAFLTCTSAFATAGIEITITVMIPSASR